MKRLGAHALISSIIIILLASFSVALPANAQSIDRQTESGVITSSYGTYDYYRGTVNPYFQAATVALDEILSRSTTTQAGPTARYKSYLSAVSGAYTTTFNDEVRKGTTPVDAQIIAIRAFNTALAASENLSGIANYNASAPQRTVISQLSRKMADAATAAQQIKNGTITPGSREAEVLTGGATTIPNAGAGNQNGTTETSSASAKCSLLASSAIINCLDAALAWLVNNTLLQIAGWILWLTSNMFSYAVQVGILNFASWAPEALYPIWIIIRQIISLAIVFIGLFLGFMYILDKEDKFEKYVPWLIMFALFVNFSYPLTRTMIDITNVVALKIYSATAGVEVLTAGISSPNSGGSLIMSKLGLQNLVYGVVASDAGAGGNSSLGDLTTLGPSLLAVAYILYAAYIFFMVSAMMVVRTVVLVILTVASPILLVDSVLPVLGERAQQLRKLFFDQLMVAPVFMIMFGLTLKFLDVFSAAAKSPMGNTIVAAKDTPIVTFFNIIIMLVMLHIMYKVTKEFSGAIGGAASNFVGKMGGIGVGLAAGGTGLLARKGIGGLASKFGQSNWVQNNKDSFMGRSALSMSNSLANASFDLRNSSIVGGGMKKIGMGMGMGSKLGYEESALKQREYIQKIGKDVGARHKEDVKDANGNIISRRGDFTEEGRKAYERYNANLGGQSIFMSKEQKAKTKELLEKNVAENLAQEEAKTKTRMEELSKSYNNVGKHSDNANKSKGELNQERDAELAKLKSDLENIKKTDSTLKTSEAQALSAAINSIIEKREDDAAASNKKLSELAAKYNNMTGNDVERRRNNIVDGLDTDEQSKFQEELKKDKAAKIAKVGAVAQAVLANQVPGANYSNYTASTGAPIINSTATTVSGGPTAAQAQAQQNTQLDIDITERSPDTTLDQRRAAKQILASHTLDKKWVPPARTARTVLGDKTTPGQPLSPNLASPVDADLTTA